MILWVKQHRRAALLVGLTLVLPLYLFFSAMGAALSARSEAVEAMDSIEPRVARMLGLIEKEDELRQALSGMSNVVSNHVYPTSSDAAAVAASLQAEARRIIADAGLEVTNSQVLAPRKRDAFDYVAVKVVARGTMEQLDQALGDIGAFRPVIFVESIDAFPNRRRRGDDAQEQMLTVSLQLLSLRIVT